MVRIEKVGDVVSGVFETVDGERFPVDLSKRRNLSSIPDAPDLDRTGFDVYHCEF